MFFVLREYLRITHIKDVILKSQNKSLSLLFFSFKKCQELYEWLSGKILWLSIILLSLWGERGFKFTQFSTTCCS